MTDNTTMIIKYWGVRGSIPTPATTDDIRDKEIALLEGIIENGGIEKALGKALPSRTEIEQYLASLPLSVSGTYGGDTTCVEVQAQDSPLIIIDAGTGARRLGSKLIQRLFSKEGHLNPLNADETTKRDMHIFLTHYHWDHIQGIPFFDPIFVPGDAKVNAHFYGKTNIRVRVSEVLAGQQQFPNFPVEWQHMPCDKEYVDVPRFGNYSITLGKTTITSQELTHPDSVFAYAVQLNTERDGRPYSKKFVFATDNEHKDRPDPRLVNLARNADVLYYDSQYTPDEYQGGNPQAVTGALPKFDWGHSTYEWAVKNGLAANVKTVVMGHHEPKRNDFKIEELYGRANEFLENQLRLPENNGKKLDLLLAHQGMEHRL